LSYIYLGDIDQGMLDLNYALKEKQTEEHSVIAEAIRDEAEVWSPLDKAYRRVTPSFQYPLVSFIDHRMPRSKMLRRKTIWVKPS
jgi:hypothetical protein